MNAHHLHNDQTAQSDFTPEAATDAMRLAVECIAEAGGDLQTGRLAQATQASKRAQNALQAACVSLAYLTGGLPR